MRPWIKEGDKVSLVLSSPSQIRLGDIIGFYPDSKSKLVIHRVIKRHPDHWITKGDNSIIADPIITEDLLSGKAVKIQRETRTIRFGLGREKEIIAYLSRLNILPVCYQWLFRMKVFLFKLKHIIK